MFEGEEMSKQVVAEVIALIEMGMIAPEDIVKCLRKANSEPEPVAQYSDIVSNGGLDPRNKFDIPATQRQWVGLTDKEIWASVGRIGTADSDVNPYAILKYARAIEAKLKEKNT
jgi:hypothetical protein